MARCPEVMDARGSAVSFFGTQQQNKLACTDVNSFVSLWRHAVQKGKLHRHFRQFPQGVNSCTPLQSNLILPFHFATFLITRGAKARLLCSGQPPNLKAIWLPKKGCGEGWGLRVKPPYTRSLAKGWGRPLLSYFNSKWFARFFEVVKEVRSVDAAGNPNTKTQFQRTHWLSDFGAVSQALHAWHHTSGSVSSKTFWVKSSSEDSPHAATPEFHEGSVRAIVCSEAQPQWSKSKKPSKSTLVPWYLLIDVKLANSFLKRKTSKR